VLAAVRSLRHEFGVICFDGQGYAHPRRCGLALHISVLLDVPGIGVVLRTGDHLRQLFVSMGHRMNLASAVELVLACSDGKRVPEPTRQADIEVAKFKRPSGDSLQKCDWTIRSS